MKGLLSAVIFMFCGFCALKIHAQESDLIQARVIAEGYFFDGTIATKQVSPGGSTLAFLKDPENRRVLAIYLPQGFELSESITAKAIPADKVQYSSELIRDYEARRPAVTAQYKGILVEVGKPMPQFNDKDVNGNIWNNNTLQGKAFVINVWQRECGPCRREMPVLSSWVEK